MRSRLVKAIMTLAVNLGATLLLVAWLAGPVLVAGNVLELANKNKSQAALGISTRIPPPSQLIRVEVAHETAYWLTVSYTAFPHNTVVYEKVVAITNQDQQVKRLTILTDPNLPAEPFFGSQFERSQSYLLLPHQEVFVSLEASPSTSMTTQNHQINFRVLVSSDAEF